ncbi:GTP pyrophosphokinase [Paucibacter sp. B2R-40]|uniref:GTP pyrophosphokinase n=1 Tax=Paucibacter sp. B2R-40 TaxID=2893554 RepID=UPI0021E4542B|nr:GTP pyrophosphokinase [Paucibacter sp. B2R-40]MCV2356550.1 GTP pyrophosphokinase [Paucibacter sp. B2R-40]
MSSLERAIAIAAEAHSGATDKAGAPYILHPLRVMLRMSSEAERIVAVLHDLIEDCSPDWSIERLKREGFEEVILDAIKSVTKLPYEEDVKGDDQEQKLARYMGFIERAGKNVIGRAVKVADLQDNMDLSRIAEPSDKDYLRLDKYRAALAALGASAK